MARIITVNAFHAGAGVSTIAANLAVALAQHGQRVGLIDASISSPTQHLLFGLPEQALPPTFNDFVLGRCDLPAAARALPSMAPDLGKGKLFVVPADPDWNEIRRTSDTPCGVDTLGPALDRLITQGDLDVVLFDSDAGLTQLTLAALALSHHLLAVVQLDHQRYQGLKVALDVAGEFDIPGKSLVVNSASPSLEAATIRQAVEGGYGLPVAGIVPYCEELSALCSSAIFILRYPDHPVARILRTIADVL